LCYAGDCVGKLNPLPGLLNSSIETARTEAFSFKNVEGKMAIEIYSIGEGNPEIKGERPIGKLKYELRN
jgi:hypothetical protein